MNLALWAIVIGLSALAGMGDQAIVDFVGVAVATVTRASAYQAWHVRAQVLDTAAYQAATHKPVDFDGTDYWQDGKR